MNQLRALVIAWGSRINPWLLVCIIVALNVYWLVLRRLNLQVDQSRLLVADVQRDIVTRDIPRVLADTAAYWGTSDASALTSQQRVGEWVAA